MWEIEAHRHQLRSLRRCREPAAEESMRASPKHSDTRITQKKVLEQLFTPFLLPLTYLHRKFWPNTTWRSQQTEGGREERARLKPGRIAEAQTQLDSPRSLQHNILDKSLKTHWCHSSTLAFSLLCGFFFFVLLNGLALLGTDIFPPQLKFEQAALGSNFWKQLKCLLPVQAGFYSSNSNLSAPFDKLLFLTACPQKGWKPFFSVLELEKTWQFQLLLLGTTEALPRSIPCRPTEIHRDSPEPLICTYNAEVFLFLPSRDRLIYIKVFQISRHHWSQSYFCLYFWVTLE